MKICFLLDHGLKDYRVPFFNLLLEKGLNFEILHPGPTNNNFDNQKQKLIKKISLGPVDFRKGFNLKDYDIVIFMHNIRILNLWLATLNPFRKYKLIHWGIGVSSSKGLSPKKTFISIVRNWLTNYADALVLYSEYPLNLYSERNQKKTFIAHNTIENTLKINTASHNKDCFLFIGTLDKRKGFDELLLSFSFYLKSAVNLKIKKLLIIGDGPFKDNIKIKVKELQLEENVVFCCKITDLEKKLKYFSRAIATISPLQAGLSVLESFSFGVPFITFENAISGGEHMNIKNNETGYLVHSNDELTKKMLYLGTKPEEAKNMGQNAFEHYYKYRRIDDMANSFIEAFRYVKNTK